MLASVKSQKELKDIKRVQLSVEGETVKSQKELKVTTRLRQVRELSTSKIPKGIERSNIITDGVDNVYSVKSQKELKVP